MSEIKFAVVGCGNIGRRHIAVIEAEERAAVVAICDVEKGKCEKIVETYGKIPSYTDYAKMLSETEADIISICTPHGLHAEMAIAAAKAGKHILVEKPMALSIKDAERMVQAANENNVKLIVVKQNRYNTPIALTKQAIEEGRLGKIYMVQSNILWNRNKEYYTESNWRGKKNLEGGALYTQVSHFIDLLIWWFGEVTEATTKLETKKHTIETEDCGSSILKFESGVMGSLTWTTCVYNKNFEGSITIMGEKGTIKVGGLYLNKIDFWDVQSFPLPENIVFEDQPNQYGKYQGTSSNHDKLINEVVKKLLNERYNVVEGDEGIKTIKAIELIYASAK